jgi:hypothetical protein
MKPDLIKSDYHSKEEYDVTYTASGRSRTYVSQSFVAGDDKR